MKIGFCMFLWTTSVSKKHEPLMRDIKATGYDGVEIPIFAGTPDDYAGSARRSIAWGWSAPRFRRWAIPI